MKKVKLFFKSYLLIIGLLTFNGMYSQNNQLRLITEARINFINMLKTSSEFVEGDYEGSPYENPKFLLGNIYVNGKLYSQGIALRYNAVEDEMELKPSLDTDTSKAQALMKSPTISLDIMNRIYIFLEGKGYFEVLYSGDNFTLFKKLSKKYYPAKKAKTSFEKDIPAEFKDVVSYFLYRSGSNLIELPASKKKRLNAFGDNSSTVKKYVKEKKLNLSKEEDLLKIVKLLDAKQ